VGAGEDISLGGSRWLETLGPDGVSTAAGLAGAAFPTLVSLGCVAGDDAALLTTLSAAGAAERELPITAFPISGSFGCVAIGGGGSAEVNRAGAAGFALGGAAIAAFGRGGGT
jgi:hypothetical protein